MVRRTVGTILAAALVVAACTSGADDGSTGEPGSADGSVSRDGTGPVLLDDVELAAALVPFERCDDLLGHVQAAALEMVGPWGLGHGGPWMAFSADERIEVPAGGDTEMATPDAGAVDDAAGGMSAPAAGPGDTGTNVQEAGVDEPDLVKTDGRHLYVASESTLRILDLDAGAAGDPVEVGRLDLGDAWDAQLLLVGDRLLVTSSSSYAVPFPAETRAADDAVTDAMTDAEPGVGTDAEPGVGTDAEPGAVEDALTLPARAGDTSTLAVVDVSDPADPVALERLTVDGSVVSARLVDGVARVVLRSEPGVDLAWSYPEGSGLRAERRATEANAEVIRASTIEQWLPYAVRTTADGATTEGTLVPCDQVNRPASFAGLGVLSVLTVDPAGGFGAAGEATTAVLASGETVYASAERLYVATTRWVDWEALDERDRHLRLEDVTSEVHAFDLDGDERARYLASGEVPGSLLSQWSMSEHEGALRVASTVGDPWSPNEPSQSVVTVLEPREDTLAVIGQVDGLGIAERIYAVRFLGDVGYVVTFRETDPLYTLDLADPTDPRVTGELKIMGYSAYLHPIGDDLLLGVGQDADEQGVTLGTQLSLFDVADPAAPTRLDQVTLSDAHSDVEHDHRAFLHWPATGLTVVPVTTSGHGGTTDEPGTFDGPSSGALAFTAAREGGIVEQGRLSHTPPVPDPADDGPGDGASGDGASGDGGSGAADPGSAASPPDEVVPMDRWYEDAWRSRILRSLVVGDRLVTVSELGVAVDDLDTLEREGFHRFTR